MAASSRRLHHAYFPLPAWKVQGLAPGSTAEWAFEAGTDDATTPAMENQFPTHKTTLASGKPSKGSSHSALETVRRIGYGAKGVLYAVLGALAVATAAGAGSQGLGFKDAIQWVSQQPFGTFLLVALVVGLAAYSLYRLVCAFFDAEGVGSDGKGWAKRIGYLGSAAAYGSLAFYAGKLMTSGAAGGNRQEAVGSLLQSQAGALLLGLVAIGLFLAAAAQLHRAWTGKYRRMFDMSELPRKTVRFVNTSAKFGLTARAVVFSLIGYFLASAVLNSNASSAGGMEKALSWLSSGTASSWAFGLVSLGLVGYSLYAFAIAYCGQRRTA